METAITFSQMVLDRIKSQCNPVNVEERFADSLDEMYGHESFFQNLNLLPSRVLKECDSIAFDQGVNDYAGCDEDLVEIDGEYYSREEVQSVKDDMVLEIENSIG